MAIPFFSPFSVDRPKFLAFSKKRHDVVKPFLTLINSFNLKNELCDSISRHGAFGSLSFLLFTVTSTIIFPSIRDANFWKSKIWRLSSFGDSSFIFTHYLSSQVSV